MEAALKACRTTLMASLFLVGWIHPWRGAVLSLVVILICVRIAGWALRRMIVSAVFSWDFITWRRRRFAPDERGNWMFAARRVGKTPVGTPGAVTLPEGRDAVGRGLFDRQILLQATGQKRRTMFLLPPRCQSHEQQMARIYGLAAIEDVRLLKGLRAFKRWFGSRLGWGWQATA